MRVGLVQEGEIHGGKTISQRYHEMIDEVCLADELGFHVFGTSEQHFSPPRFTISAPEVLYSAIAARTKNIKIRTMCSVLLQWNHPILIAERLATLDIVSKGRAEIATARSNNLHTLEAFGVPSSDTARQFDESMEVLVKALTDELIEHDGDLWKIPPREIVPRCVQTPHPPMWMAASSVASHEKAGRKGLGVIAFESYFGFDYLQDCIDAFRKAQAGNREIPAKVVPNDDMSIVVTSAYCAKSKAEAIDLSRDMALGYFQFMIDLYGPLAKHQTYEYLDRMEVVMENAGNLDFLLTETPSVMIGTPDEYVERLRDLKQRGIDEVLLRIDGMNTEDIKRSVELIGREVLPHI